jgi:EmrB/QacA subfamily drug resistance transporter
MTRYRHLITDDNAKWWTLGAMCFALFMLMLDNTVMNVALPTIQRDLGSSLSGLEWTINGYTLAIAVLLVTGGRLGDIFGRRRMFLIGVTLFALSSMSAGLAADTGMLIGSRVVQGIGAALMMPATLSIVTHAFPPEERGRALGTWAGISALALAIGPVLGGFLTEHVSWRAIFYINVPVAIGAVIATIFAVRESRDETVGREVDYLGVATVTGALTALVLALIEGNSWGWGSPGIIALLAGSAVLMTAFVLIEFRVRAPVVEFPLFASRNFVGTNLVALIVTFAMLGQFFFMALYMQNILGYSALEAGVRFLPATLMIVVVAPLAGRLTDRIGSRWPIAAGLSLVAASLYWLTTIDVATTYADIWPSFVLMGLGMALVMSPMTTAAMNAVATAKAGIASGILSMSRMVGGTLGVAVLGAIFQGQVGAEVGAAGTSPAAFVDAFASAMWVATGVVAAGALLTIVLITSARGREARPAGEPTTAEQAALEGAGATPTGELAAADHRAG